MRVSTSPFVATNCQTHQSSESSTKESRKLQGIMKRILRQDWIEKLWQPRILRQLGIQTDQSEREDISQSESSKTNNGSAVKPQVRVIKNKKTTEPSTTSAPGPGASTESAPGLSEQYKKQKRRLFNPILSQMVEQNTSIPTRRSPSSSIKQFFSELHIKQFFSELRTISSYGPNKGNGQEETRRSTVGR